MYGQNTTTGYNNGAMVGVPGLTNWNYNNPYAGGGLNFGQPAAGTVVTPQNNNTQSQLNDSYQWQLAERQQQAGAGQGGGNFLADMLKQIQSGMGGAGGTGGINYSSGITAGPVYTPDQVAQASNGMQQYANTVAAQPLNAPGVTGGMQAAMQRQMKDGTSAGVSQFQRDAAYGNAQHQLASERARAQSGVRLANLGQNIQSQNQNQLMRLLQMMTGMIG